MRKLSAFALGFLLFALGIFVVNCLLDSFIETNKAGIRDLRVYERYQSAEVNKAIIDDETLVIFGSSELRSLEDYREGTRNFLNSDNFNVLTMGGGNFQSISHVMELGALDGSIPRKEIALFLSPQWFSSGGVDHVAFAARFSEDEFIDFLQNPSISDESKYYVSNRVRDMLADSPAQLKRVNWYIDAWKHPVSLSSCLTAVMDFYWDFSYKLDMLSYRDEIPETLPTVDLEHMDFEMTLELADEQGKMTCSNNDFGIEDLYWDTYCKDYYESVLEEGLPVSSTEIFVESVEYEDFICFLNVAQELGYEVNLVHIPVNAYWYNDVKGMSCQIYYQNIRDIAMKYENVSLIDMTSYEYEKYFFNDIMHIGWKGWTRINEALYTNFTAE